MVENRQDTPNVENFKKAFKPYQSSPRDTAALAR